MTEKEEIDNDYKTTLQPLQPQVRTMNNLPPPKAFVSKEGDTPEEWREWRQQFITYLKASRQDKEDEDSQCAILLHIIGSEPVRAFRQFQFEKEEDKTVLKIVLDKFEAYYIPQRNVTVERHKFFTRAQSIGETIDQYVVDLRGKAKTCEFRDLEDSLIKDRIVCGITSDSVRGRLLRESNLTLQTAIDMCRAEEQSKSRLKQINTEEREVHAVRGTPRSQRNWQSAGSSPRSPSRKSQQRSQSREKSEKPSVTSGPSTSRYECRNCGYEHSGRKCPALGKQCVICRRYDHFAKKCRSKQVNVIQEDECSGESDESECSQGQERMFVDTINVGKKRGSWTVKLDLPNSQSAMFKVDSGSDANVLPLSVFQKLDVCKEMLLPSNELFTSYTNEEIPIIGKCFLKCMYKKTQHIIEFHVVNAKSIPILGLDSGEKMGIIKRVNSIQENNKENKIVNKYKDVFEGIGCLKDKLHIEVDPSVKPVVHSQRKFPIALLPQVKDEIARLEKLGIVERVTKATDWVNSMVVVRKPNGTIRVCLDPSDLNKAIKREYYNIPTFDEIVSKIGEAKYFSTLDANNGFFQIPLDAESSKLCTFNTPMGRYKFLRLPFGICSAPEIFSRTIKEMFDDMTGVEIYIDDIVIWGSTREEHDARLIEVLKRARKNNLRFNKEKCKILCSEVKYMGHILSRNGVSVDKERVEAIVEMQTPKNKTELERFLGMVNYVSRFIPNMSSITAPLRELLKKEREWQWNREQETAFDKLKNILITRPVLQFYDVNKPVKISVDASQNGVAAVLMQDDAPVAYASRAFTNAQKNYAQIEKEMCAVEFGCKKFHEFIYGRQAEIETDHKPLEAIHKKPLNECPPRLQRMLFRIQQYSLQIKYKPGKELYFADTLSRAFQTESTTGESQLDSDLHAQVCLLMAGLPVTEGKKLVFQKETLEDKELQILTETIGKGWPENKSAVNKEIIQYWNYRHELTVAFNIVFKGNRIIVPKSLRKEMLQKIHTSHLGIEKCKSRARELLFWPNMNNEIENVVRNCDACIQYHTSNRKEPLLQHEIPQRPWEKIGVDLFEINRIQYLLVIDYYSRFVEISALSKDTTSNEIIRRLKPILARHGICKTLFSDNGPQFDSEVFKKFAEEWNFEHVTSSAKYAQSNGMIERSVQTVKRILQKAALQGDDVYLCLLEYRNTPINNNIGSPAQILMGRRLNGVLPIKTELLMPAAIDHKLIKQAFKTKQLNEKKYYDRGSVTLPELKLNDRVRVQKQGQWYPGLIVNALDKPRSYKIKMESGAIIERNRRHIMKDMRDIEEGDYIDKCNSNNLDGHSNSPHNSQEKNKSPRTVTQNNTPARTTRYGRTIKSPKRLHYT